MVANVESMVFTGEVPWHKLGQQIDHAMSWEEAQELSGMNFKAFFADVEAVAVINGVEYRTKIPHRRAIMRNTDLLVMGEVSDDYRIVQNDEAFAFVVDLAGEGVLFETAGVLRNPYNNNVKTWILGKTDHITVLGDRIEPYIVFMNSFDGKSGVTAAMVTVRVVCQNTLTLALDRARRTWSMDHTGDIQSKLNIAKRALGLMQDYVEEFPELAEELASINLYKDEITRFLDELFPAPDPEDDTELRKRNREYLKGMVIHRYETVPDVQKFRGTGWGMYNSVVDVANHMPPMRATKNWRENRFIRTVNGDPIIHRAQRLLMAIRG
jgi:phage/plasmid-like protein (TIGR03299 family)